MTVRIGMLGSGFVADFYMQGLRDVPNQEVVVNHSRSAQRAHDFACRWGIPAHTTRIADVLQRTDVDLVVIGLPNHLHRDVVIAAADAGKAMVITKPLGRSAAEAREMLAAVRRAGVWHGYAETEVFCPSVMHARQMIVDGAIGDVLTMRLREAHSGSHSPYNWRRETAGGGVLLTMGSHTVEAARYLVGKEVPVVEVMAWGDRLLHHEKMDVEDTAVALLRFEGGQLAYTDVAFSARGGLDLRNEVYGTKGAIFTDVTRGTPVRAFTLGSAGYVLEKAEADAGWVFPVPDEARVYGYHEELRHFVECLTLGVPAREDFADGYAVNVIIDAAYRSMESKRWEPVSY